MCVEGGPPNRWMLRGKQEAASVNVHTAIAIDLDSRQLLLLKEKTLLITLDHFPISIHEY